jgi:ribosomal protein S18 acetylase RimI-like enzyme
MRAKLKTASLQELEILLNLMEQYYEHDRLDFSRQRAEAALRQILSDSALGCIWLIIDSTSEEILGYLALTYAFYLEYGGRSAIIDELFLKKDFREQGLGTLAIDHAAKHCRSNGILSLRLEVTQHNSRALGLYRRLGFHDHERCFLTLKL